MEECVQRTVPFLTPHSEGVALRLGELLVVPRRDTFPHLHELLGRHLSLGSVGDTLSAKAAEPVVAEQYEACLEHVFSSPTWEAFRASRGQLAIIAYMTETRHYLHAATARMAAGVAAMPHHWDVSSHLSEHLIEEADHARFFENALELLGIPRAAVSQLRPLPATLAWILVMRASAFEDPLAAALCSGLMESSAADRPVVSAWHEMLVSNSLLPAEVVNAMREHVDLDAQLGHGDNWRDCLSAFRRIDTLRLVRALNSVTIVAEAARNWSDSLLNSPIGTVAAAVNGRATGGLPRVDAIFNGDRVWSAAFLDDLADRNTSTGYSSVVTAAYSLSDHHLAAGHDDVLPEFLVEARRVREACSVPADPAPGKSIGDTIDAWLCSINGHHLWDALLHSIDACLAGGWILENYHYLAASARHVSAAIFSCPDAELRQMLTRHLKEEAHHEDILAAALRTFAGSVDPGTLRPLPSTVAFIGYLRELAFVDWKAYVVALNVLQRSLRPGDERHSQFYARMARTSREAAALAGAMRQHDEVDGQLNHHDQADHMLDRLCASHDVTAESMRRAAMVPMLAWGFLDGILKHYSNGPLAILQRQGWTCEY